jgi:hypothetical protein
MKRLVDLALVAGAIALTMAPIDEIAKPARATNEPAPPKAATPPPAEVDALLRLTQASKNDAPPSSARHRTTLPPLDADRAGAPWGQRVERPGPTAAEMTPELIEACMAVAHDIDEKLAKRLETLRETDPSRFVRKIVQSRRLIAMAELREKDPVLYDLKLLELRVDADVSRLAIEVRRARREGRESDAAVLEEDLRRQTIVQLGFRLMARDDYLCRLRDLVERLEKDLEHDRKHFNELLEKRMAELLREPGAPRTERADPALPAEDPAAS